MAKSGYGSGCRRRVAVCPCARVWKACPSTASVVMPLETVGNEDDDSVLLEGLHHAITRQHTRIDALNVSCVVGGRKPLQRSRPRSRLCDVPSTGLGVAGIAEPRYLL